MVCEICGKEIEKSYYSNAVLCSTECFKINYWLEFVLKKNNKDMVRCNGTHYVIGDEDSKSCFRGFEGKRFKVCFFDGRVIETTNLWCQGDIPKEFRKELKDNAVIICK
jgi:hypothetical protein